jgi:2-polyprenyl-3-methyl-5-hydroxy-6-metoxy-1,4-benzoquinol methylase
MELRVDNPSESITLFDSANYQLSFYSEFVPNGIKRITKPTLEKLAAFSTTIAEPFIIGKFNDEEHYLKTLKLALSSTLETRNRILFFLNVILPMIVAKDSLLDIGPGDGSLTRKIARYFKNITVVDSNQHILNKLQLILASSNYIKINKNILYVDFKSNYHDLAILSHVLYYIEPKFWLNVIKSAYNSLKQNGILVIVMGVIGSVT